MSTATVCQQQGVFGQNNWSWGHPPPHPWHQPACNPLYIAPQPRVCEAKEVAIDDRFALVNAARFLFAMHVDGESHVTLYFTGSDTVRVEFTTPEAAASWTHELRSTLR